ncbi:unnamed protein product [Musa textilis]
MRTPRSHSFPNHTWLVIPTPIHCSFKSKARPGSPAGLSFHSNPILTSFPDLRDDKILERTLARALLALSLMKTPRRPPLDFNSDAAGCLSGVIRRLLCASLRHNVHSQGVAMQKKKPPASPCVVARLMGLDSMPVFPYTPPDSVKRSRSAESWPGVSCSEGSRGMQIKTSVSFRGAPTYLRQENEEFLVLSFAPERKAETTMAKGRKDKASTGDSKEREANRAERRVAEKKTRNQQKNSHKHQQNLPERKHKNGRGSVVPSPKEKLRRDSRTITKLGGSNGKAAEQKKMQKLAAARGRTRQVAAHKTRVRFQFWIMASWTASTPSPSALLLQEMQTTSDGSKAREGDCHQNSRISAPHLHVLIRRLSQAS